MPDIPNINSVMETFMYYWYENALLDPGKLNLLFAPTYKIQCQTTQLDASGTKFIVNDVSNLEIAMWTPQTITEGYSLVVMVNWKNKNNELILTSNDTFYMQKAIGSHQQKGLQIKSLTSHIVNYKSTE